MPSLGVFGEVREAEAEDSTFEFFDQTLRINPDFGILDIVDFIDLARDVDENDLSTIAIVKDLFRTVLHPEDFATFWTAARKNRQDIGDLIKVAFAVIEAVTARPTVRPSDSSAGPSTTSLSSTGGLSSRVIGRLEGQGRPDLALLVQRAQEQLAG